MKILLMFLQISLFSIGRCSFSLLQSPKNLKNYTNLLMSYAMSESCNLITDFKEFNFAPSKLATLPIERNKENYVRRHIQDVVFSQVRPTPVVSPRLVSYSGDVLRELLDLDSRVAQSEEFVDFVAGNNVLESSITLAHRYGGHQFGYWAMQLGDGRAIIIGEYINRAGERWELQLKGSGKTPYSRDGDGRAVLRSSIREHLCSEAMHYLGIPTSRSGAIIVSENRVMRDPLYDGHPQMEPLAVVLRLAPSWFRIGSLELLARNNEIDLLKNLLDFIIKEHFADIYEDENRVLNFISRVIRSSSDLVIAWQAVGFTHGVMNTDNISLLGVTIDYGPFGFMEAYDPMYVPNHSDSEARYCYKNQTQIMIYNLLMLAKALAPLMSQEQLDQTVQLLQYEQNYINSKLDETFSRKLGFKSTKAKLVSQLTDMLAETKADFIMAFRQLGETPLSKLDEPSSQLWALKTLATHSEFPTFINSYKEELKNDDQTDHDRMDQMCKLNPRYTLRNWMAQDAIKLADKGDFSEVNLIQKILKTPYTRQEEAEKRGYASKPPTWSRNLVLSCSS